MKTDKANWSTISYIAAFLLGVVVFWSFGKDWLHLESALVFIAGLIGVALPVLIFGVWSILRHSNRKN